MLQNSKTQNVTKLKNTKCNQLKNFTTQELKMLKNSKTQNMTKLKKNKNVTKLKTKIMTKLISLNWDITNKLKL